MNGHVTTISIILSVVTIKFIYKKRCQTQKQRKEGITTIATYIIVVTVSSLKKRNEYPGLKYKTIDDIF